MLKVKSEYGLAVPSATGAALLSKPVSRGHSMRFDVVRACGIKSRIVSWRVHGSTMLSMRCAGTRDVPWERPAPTVVLAEVIAAFSPASFTTAWPRKVEVMALTSV